MNLKRRIEYIERQLDVNYRDYRRKLYFESGLEHDVDVELGGKGMGRVTVSSVGGMSEQVTKEIVERFDGFDQIYSEGDSVVVEGWVNWEEKDYR